MPLQPLNNLDILERYVINLSVKLFELPLLLVNDLPCLCQFVLSHAPAHSQSNAEASKKYSQLIYRLFHALSPLAFALNTYASFLLRNADSRRDFGRFYPPLLLHGIAFCAPFCE
jgi:hypothetical protein